MSPYLLVYGTLLSHARHSMGARLRRQSKLIGAASIQGRLYRVASYPGLVEDADPQMRAHGEVYELNSPAMTFAWLDAYEGILPGAGDQNEYERVERPVCLASGEQMTAWVYLYRKGVSPAALIPDGRWVSP